ncbi:hypothetical protein LPA49_01560 [Pseudoalteromonas sp. MB41]|uniref:hypothetical protein n=1 Tax=Pseudoalteromonas sp. MB41 TaxID=2896366 RepID=UPI001E4904D6|nr:hypothetical protein [Pseudoalteromonas sp. MB41]MCC9659236.1 hypothetical protein [Pseudoalteromonas sp. MB41]
MAKSFFSLVTELETLLGQLNTILAGADDETVQVNGVTKDSISKAIKSNFESLRTMVSGKKSFSTLSELNADLVHPKDTLAEVWNDPTESNNGVYGKIGDSGTGSWQKSKFDSFNQLYNQIFTASIKFKSPLLTQGEVFNGASPFDGENVSQDTSVGGWIIPQGETGGSTYNRYIFDFLANDSASYSGRKARFIVVLETSQNILESIPNWVHQVNTIGTTGKITNKTYYQESDRKLVILFDYEFSGDETRVSTYLQVSNSNPAVGNDVWVKLLSQNWSFIDAQSGSDVLNKELTAVKDDISSLSNKLSSNNITSGELFPYTTFQSQLFNGAELLEDGNGLFLPAGSNGVNSYITFLLPLDNFASNSGTKVRLRLEITTSDNLLDYLTLASNVNGTEGIAQAVAGSIKKELIDQNTILVTADYILRGSTNERMGIYVQVASTINTSEDRFFHLKSNSFQIVESDNDLETPNDIALKDKLDKLNVSSGDLTNILSLQGQLFNGSSFINDSRGLLIPAGSSGQSSYCRYLFPIDSLNKYKGAKLQIDLLVDTSDKLTDETNLASALSVFKNDGTANYNAVYASKVVLSDSLMLLRFTWELTGDEKQLGPYFQIAGSSLRSTDGFINLRDLRFKVIDSNSKDVSTLEVITDFREEISKLLSEVVTEPTYFKVVTVKKDGSGDYVSLKDACAIESGKSNLERVKIELHEGVYSESNYHIPNFVDVVGIGDRDRIWLKGELPNDVEVSSIPTFQTIWMNRTSKLINIKITAKNMRYPIHSDSGASPYKALQHIIDCYVEHFGNQDARDYQESIGGDANSVWGAEHAWGCGTHSGQQIYSIRTIWVSKTSPFYFHTNKDFKEPCYVELNNSKSICTTDDGHAIVLQALGSGQPDRLVIKDSELRGHLRMNDAPWLSTKQENQKANRMEIEVHISGSTNVAWAATQTAQTLELRSIEGANSSVLVDGSAADALFGIPDYRVGSIGLPAKVYSQWSIVGSIEGVSLGQRLGDCTSAHKVLNITFDSVENTSLILDQDYSQMSNSTVLAELNNALNDNERAFYISNPFENVAKIYQPEHEVTVKNVSNSGIKRGDGIAMEGSMLNARLMKSSDDKDLFLGIALEDIPAGQLGRVQKSGAININHINVENIENINFRDQVEISDIDGTFRKGTTTPLLFCSEIKNSSYVGKVMEFK